MSLACARLGLERFTNVSLMADAADSITNGFTAVFGDDGARGMCWYHARACMFKRSKQIKDKAKRSEIEDQISNLQVLQTKPIFDKAVMLFYHRYFVDNDEEVVNFMVYFKAEWIDKHSNWFEGYMNSNDQINSTGSVANNNGLEATNGDVKESHTLREQLSIQAWVSVSTNMVWTFRF